MKIKAIILAALVAAMFATSAQAAGGQVGVTGGVSFPFGDFSDVASTGFNVGLTGDWNLTEQFAVGGEVGWHGFGGNDDFEKSLSADAGSSVDATISLIPVLVHAKWLIPGSASMMPYLKGGLGFYNSKFKAEWSGGSDEETNTDFGFELGGGVNYKLNENLTWGVDAAFQSIQTDGDSSNMATVRAQLLFGVGK